MAPSVRFARGSLLTACVVASGCSGRSKADRDTAVADTASQPAASATDSTPSARGDSVIALLETGCGGGFSGGGGGTFLTTDGRFYRFERTGPPPNAKRQLTFVRKDAARAVALVEAAERAGITRIKYSIPANMTCHLSLDRDGTSHEVAWGIGTKPSEIDALLKVATDLEAAAR